MDIKCFLNKVCQEIKYEPIRKEIAEELELHIQDIKEEYISNGMEDKKAEEKAILQMGNAEEIGKKLNKIHRPKLDWKLIVLISVLMGYGLFISILKFMSPKLIGITSVGNTIIYMLIGVILGMCIYFFDYRKLKKYTSIIYTIATVIMLLPITGLGHRIAGVSYVKFLNITFNPCTIAIPLYIISFIGYVINYNKENIINLQTNDIKFTLSLDLIKILLLSIVSLILIANIPSFINAAILGFVYLVIGTVKIIQNKENRIRKLVLIYIPIFIIILIILFLFITNSNILPYRFESYRIMSSFKPEIDPIGYGYTGMLQKEILNNAKLIGEANTQIITSDDYIISQDTTFTFIYLIRKNRYSSCRSISNNNYSHFTKTNSKCKEYKRRIWKVNHNWFKYFIYCPINN